MTEFASTPEGLIQALDDFALHVGGDRYFVQELDGAGQGREFTLRGRADESFVTFKSHRLRDPSTDEVTEMVYILEDGVTGTADALPGELAKQIGYEQDPEDTIKMRDYTSYNFTLSDKIVEVIRTQAFHVDDQFDVEVAVIGKHLVYDPDLFEQFEPVITRDEETGFSVVEYALPGEDDDPEAEIDEFERLMRSIEVDTSKIDKTIGTMMLVLTTLRG